MIVIHDGYRLRIFFMWRKDVAKGEIFGKLDAIFFLNFEITFFLEFVGEN